MRDSEQTTKTILEAQLPGAQVELHDTGDAQGAHDFNLVRDGCIFAAVEVTTTTRPAVAEMNSILEQMNYSLLVKQVRRNWNVYISEKSRIKLIREQMDSYLAEIEKEGLREFFSETDSTVSLAVERIWKNLKVEAGFSHSASNSPKILVSHCGGGCMVSAEYVQEAVERESRKPDNRRKLCASSVNDRHLFVIIDAVTDYPAWKGMNSCEPPLSLPNLPVEITTVWAATWARPATGYVVWRVTPPRPWEDLGVVPAKYAEKHPKTTEVERTKPKK
jgi:hypothetical protein